LRAGWSAARALVRIALVRLAGGGSRAGVVDVGAVDGGG